MSILSKKQMSEEDIQLQYYPPLIQSKWDLDHSMMKTKIDLIVREKLKKADYVLYINANAIV